MASAPTEEQIPETALPAGEPARALPAPGQTAHTTDEKPRGGKGGALRKWIVLLVVLLAVGVTVWKIRRNTAQTAAEGQRMAAAADRPIPVQVQAVQQKTMPIYLTALGTVTAYNTVTLRSRVDGQIMRVLFREGQTVKKGQLLVEIDPRPYQAALAQAQGQLARDQANAKNADAEAARYTALYQAGVVSKESQQTQVSTAGQASGTLQADQAAIDAARVNVTYTRITSPIDGVVGLRQVDPGNIVHSSDTNGLVVVTQVHPIAVIFTLPEDYLPQVLARTRGGHQLAVDAFDRSETTHLASGTLLTVDNQIDTTTGTVKVKSVFNNQEGTLFPNQFVNVRLILQQRQDAIVVPAAALQTGAKGAFLYVVRPGDPPPDKQPQTNINAADGKGAAPASGGRTGSKRAGGGGPEQPQGPNAWVEAVPVKVDLTEGSQVILASGVKAGEQIVVDGQERLRDGSRVIPHESQARPSTTRSDADSPLMPRSQTGQQSQQNQQSPQAKPRQGAPAPQGSQP